MEFASSEELWAWLRERGTEESEPGVWVRLFRSTSDGKSIRFEQLLMAGLAFGWSESGRRRYDDNSFLQRFTPRRTARVGLTA